MSVFGSSRVSPTRPLRVGVQLPEVEYVARWPELRRMALLAEDIGLDSIWVGDHHLYRDETGARGPWEAWTQLAAIAAVTERVTLGPLVAATSFHRPGVLARLAATVDEVSGGRLVVGLGAGWNEPEYRAFDFPFDERVARFEEAFTIIRTLLRGDRLTYHGRFNDLVDAELLPASGRPGGPPLLVGSVGPRMLAITLPHVDAWNAWYAYFGNTPEGYRVTRDLVDAACREAGRDPASVARTVALLVTVGDGPRMRDFDREPAPPITGTPEEIAAVLRAFAAEGVAEVQLVLDPITPASIEWLVPVLEALDRP